MRAVDILREVAVRMFAFAAILMVLGCASSGTTPTETSQDLDALKIVTARGAAFSDAITAASAAGWAPEQVGVLVAFYTDDAILFPPRGEPIRGRAEILRYWQRSPERKILEHTVTVDSVVGSTDVISDYGTFVLTSQVSDSAPSSGTARYLSVWKRGRDGVWRKRVDSWW